MVNKGTTACGIALLVFLLAAEAYSHNDILMAVLATLWFVYLIAVVVES